MVVLVKLEYENCISYVSIFSVKIGIVNILGNKGVVGVFFMFNGILFGFVNCYFILGNEKMVWRN